MTVNQKPGLFGIKYSNKDFSHRDSWGKNQFNSTFPVALASYLSDQGQTNVYLKVDKDLNVYRDRLSSRELFGIDPKSNNLFFSFESQFTPFQKFLIGSFPRIDLVTQLKDSGKCLKGIEIKLTALPDNSTCAMSDSKFGCELVIRPDTIVYLACSIAKIYDQDHKKLRPLFGSSFKLISDWSDPKVIMPYIPKMLKVIDNIVKTNLLSQEPLVMQPVWKTIGKSPKLAKNCLDVFAWSNLAFSQLFCDVVRNSNHISSINRPTRTMIWLFKMLYDFALKGQFNHEKIIDGLSYNNKNDKAFALNGSITHSYMTCKELTKPRITKVEIKNIILGGGQNLLSPERRFDAIIFNPPELFPE